VIAALRKDGVLGAKPFQTPIDFLAFDLWHYDGRTSKHGAFMGGADFVQWHGNYELLKKQIQLESMAEELRGKHAHGR
jgi:hydroxylamine dehydrogenase